MENIFVLEAGVIGLGVVSLAQAVALFVLWHKRAGSARGPFVACIS